MAQHSVDVSICHDRINNAANKIWEGIQTMSYSPAMWKSHSLHPHVATESTVDWIFFLDLMNFGFWSDRSELYTVLYKGERYTGYWSLCAAINRALDEGIPITSPEYMRSVTKETLQHIFRSETSTLISFLDERHTSIQEAGQILVDCFQGSFVNIVKQADQSCQKLITLVVTHFPTFRDSTLFAERIVHIYKRAQILVADLWACFECCSYGQFNDIDSITMFADYRVPQAMIHFGLIKYSEKLFEHLQMGYEIPKDHVWEIEIRGNSIWAIELVKDRLRQMNQEALSFVNSILIDFFLWDYAKSHSQELKSIPIHKTRTLFY